MGLELARRNDDYLIVVDAVSNGPRPDSCIKATAMRCIPADAAVIASSSSVARLPRQPWATRVARTICARDRDRHFSNRPAIIIRMPIVGMFHTSERANGKSAIYKIA